MRDTTAQQHMKLRVNIAWWWKWYVSAVDVIQGVGEVIGVDIQVDEERFSYWLGKAIKVEVDNDK